MSLGIFLIAKSERVGLWKAWYTVPNLPYPSILPRTKSLTSPLYRDTVSDLLFKDETNTELEAEEDTIGFDYNSWSYFDETFFLIYYFVEDSIVV